MKLKYFGLALLCLLLLTLLLLPWGLSIFTRSVIINYIQDQGMQQVEVDNIWINPYLAEMSLQQLAFVPENAQAPFRLDHMFVDISVASLFKKDIKLVELSLSGMEVDLTLVEDLLWLNGIAFSQNTGSSASASEENTPEASGMQVNDSSGGFLDDWRIGIESLHIQDISASLKLPTQALMTEMVIEKISVKDIDNQGAKGLIQVDIGLDEFHMPDLELRQKISLTMPTSLTLGAQNALALEIEPRLVLENTSVITPEYQVDIQAFAVGTVATIDSGSYSATSELSFEGVNVSLRQEEGKPRSLLALNQLHSQIDLHSRFFSEGEEGAMTTDSDFEQIIIKTINIDGVRLLESDEKQIPTLVEGGAIDIGRMELVLPASVDAGNSPDPIILRIESILLHSGVITLLRREDGALPQFSLLTSNQAEVSDVALPEIEPSEIEPSEIEPEGNTRLANHEGAGSTPPLLDLQIANFHIANSLSIGFQDYSSVPVFEESIQFEQFAVQDIRPFDQEYLSSLQASLLLSHEASLSLDGQMTLDASNSDLHVL